MQEYILIAVWIVSFFMIAIAVTQWLKQQNDKRDYIVRDDYTFRDFYTKK